MGIHAIGGACIRIQAGLGVAADSEEEGIDGSKIAERIEDDEREQRAASNVDICSTVRFYLLQSAQSISGARWSLNNDR